jgi:choline kinase
MQAIIMAAGKGSRLGELTKDKPKSFIEIKGVKLLEYNISLLHEYGIKDIIIVTGYMTVEKLCEKIEGVKCVFNPFYEQVNVLGSFYIGMPYIKDDVIYMHADTLCSPSVFERMINENADIVLPVDYKICDEEAMKVKTIDNKIVEISKQIPCSEAEGEFIGIAKISKKVLNDIKHAAKILMQQKNFTSYFEGAIEYLIKNEDYKPTPISTNGEFWGEIDFMEDYERVCESISDELVNIAKRNDIGR